MTDALKWFDLPSVSKTALSAISTMHRRGSIPGLTQATAALLLLSLAASVRAHAAECPRKGTLGTSRTLYIDPVNYPRVGSKNFPQTLPLRDHEVVLTFDDGPLVPTTSKVLAALAAQCVHATFFMIGKPAGEHPAMVRRVAAGGHRIGSHTFTHFNLQQMPQADAVREIDEGIAAIEFALHGEVTKVPSTPFFRFPGFLATSATLDLLESRRIIVFGADFWANDWEPGTPAEEFHLLTSRLKTTRKGIILLHDSQPRTAAVLPRFLRYLRDNHYHVVDVAPVRPGVDFSGVP